MIPTLTVDDLEFEVRWSDSRKPLGLTVNRGGELVLSAPRGCDTGLLEDFVCEKRFWLYTKLAEKEALQATVPAKELVSGEGFPYLDPRQLCRSHGGEGRRGVHRPATGPGDGGRPRDPKPRTIACRC